MYEITVAVCVYKQKEWLHRCLRSLNSQTLEKSRYEKYLLENFSIKFRITNIIK